VICEQCGAVYEGNVICDDRFSLLLAKEFSRQEYWAVHHLSVPSYYLQHNLYSKEGWLLALELLRKFVTGELTPETARRINHKSERNFSITKDEKLTEASNINWSFTIADVRLDSPDVYCRDVVAWAKNIIDDAAHLMEGFA
jgi:hypothetical protein